MPKLRTLRLATLDDAIAEIERLRDHGYTPRGRWSLSQMSDHLTKVMRVGMDGSMPRLPWLARKMVWPLARWTLWRGAMISGAPAPKPVLPAEARDDESAIDRCLATLAEARDRREPIPPYVLLDGLTLDDWKRLMVIHAQHHLRFLEPTPTSTPQVAAQSTRSNRA
ncbi:DUF1569 domain-containing protein [Botrimarina mediterranea]|uniref:DUF1569 domain-containing protein n=1 Tax=Botrimarina mediterranea TaxID=2528022 RepID=UPI00118A78D7|nr:hypothetical protein K2D_40940 [Planctomycetes bacterium K2D]